MIRRVVLLTAALALPATVSAQSRDTPHASLRPFRSDAELARFVERWHDPEWEPPEPDTEPAPDICPPPSVNGGEARQAAVVQGRVTSTSLRQPEEGVRVRLACWAATTGADGTYRLVIPGEHIGAGKRFQITAWRGGWVPITRSITLAPGAQVTQDFIVGVMDIWERTIIGDDASLTSNPPAGGDKGAIVKRHGDYLLILRRGRLFTVDVSGGNLRPVTMVDAFDGNGGDDEMMVSGDQVVVIRSSYRHNGTEIGLFRIDGEGGLQHRGTYHMRSGHDSWYSSYASRLIGTRLVILSAVEVQGRGLDDWLPTMRRWHAGERDGEFRRIVAPGNVYAPVRPLHDKEEYPMLYAVTRCELGGGRLECQAMGVLGPEHAGLYVSPTAVYAWTTGWDEAGAPASTLYRIPLLDGAPAALRVEGSPENELSFLESDDGHLNVLVRPPRTNAPPFWREERDASVRLLRVPIHRFGGAEAAARDGDYRPLPSPGSGDYFIHNRFVGRHLLYGRGNEGDSVPAGGDVLFAVGWDDGRVARLPIPHGLDRIEVMGGNAVVVGVHGKDLHFTGIRLGDEPRVAQGHVQRNAQPGEKHSDGFFYHVDGPDEGVIGLPLRIPRQHGWSYLLEGSASVLFLRSQDRVLHPLGELEARPGDVREDECLSSCVEWYGNSRPIFLGDRILALLGYEIVEGAVVDGRIREVRRASFAPLAGVAANP